MKIYDQLLGFNSEILYLNFTSKLGFSSYDTTLTLANDTIFTDMKEAWTTSDDQCGIATYYL